VFEVARELSDVRARDGRPLSRTSQLALVALREALATAGAEGGAPPAAERVGVIVGTTVGCTFNDVPSTRLPGGRGPALEAVERYLANDLAEVLAEEVGARGPRVTVPTPAPRAATPSGWGPAGSPPAAATG
jgi:3-oxoacyl-(acyl-carrier-protein) synthase